MRPRGTNVVLVVMDSARRDAFGPHTPNLWELGERGIRFDKAVAPAGWTLPSHVSMFTGLRPTEHQVTGRTGGAEKVLSNSRTRVRGLRDRGLLLAPTLRENGIATWSASASPWVTAASGLNAGFDTTDYFNFLQTGRTPKARLGLPKRLRQTINTVASMRDHAEWLRRGRDKGAARVLEGFDRFVSATDQPFFAFTNLMDTHEPHVAPERPPGWALRNVPETLNTVLQPGIVRILRLHAHNWGVVSLPQRLIERWKTAYREEIAYVDRWVGSLMEVLDRHGRLEETTVIVTADHGETWGEGGTVGHGISLREGLANVPLFMAGPGVECSNPVDGPVSLCAIAGTVKTLMLGSEDASLTDEDAHGFAMMEIEDPPQVAHRPRGAKRNTHGPGVAIYDGTLKLVVDPFSGTTQLFDLSADPEETTDVIATRSPSQRQARELDAWRERVRTQGES